MKILIVDDEALARERLHDLVQELHSEASVYEAKNGLDALAKINDLSPDIVLLDIRMSGMDGVEVAKHVLHMQKPPAIVFTTAYQEHAISAFDANAVDYLLKPIRKDRLKIAIERAATVSHAKMTMLSENIGIQSRRTHVSTIEKGNLQLIPIEKIHYLKAEQKYVTAAWPGSEILLDESLISLEFDFPNRFIRIHRNAMVDKNRVSELIKKSDGKYAVKLTDMSIELIVSRRYLASVKKALHQMTL